MAKKASEKSEVSSSTEVQVSAKERIFELRGNQVVLDTDLAEFYGVETKHLMQAVRRNTNRFPEDFMFQMSDEETESLRSQIVTSKEGRGGRRSNPNVFTEQGALAVSGVIKGERAAEVSVAIARAFVSMRDQLVSIENNPAFKKLVKRVDGIEKTSKNQAKINRATEDCFADLEPFLEAIENESQDPSLD